MSISQPRLSSACFHCGEPIPPGFDVRVNIGGQAEPMCCHGCAAVAETIEAAGLSDFYARREALGARGTAPLPMELNLRAYDDPRLWSGYVQADTDGLNHVSLLLEGVTCQACVWLNERRLRELPGVAEVSANYTTRRLRVGFRPDQLPLSQILTTVASLGYRATPYDEARADASHVRERQLSLMRVGIAGLFSMQVMMVAFALYAREDLGPDWQDFFNGISLLLSLPVVTWCAWPFYWGAWRDLSRGRLGMDVPVALGVLAAFVGSCHAAWLHGEVWWDSATMFVFLLLGGRHLELIARRGAEDTALVLARMVPALAHRLPAEGEDGAEEDIPVADLKVGDRVRVRPGELIPADGRVVSGYSSVDQALLTGESTPIPRGIGDPVIGGSQNIESPLDMAVEAVGEAALLAGLARLLERAQSGKSALTETADALAAWFIGGVLLLTAGVAIHGWLAGDPSTLQRCIAILVASCPCALSLAAPAVVVAVSARWLKGGLLATRAHAVEGLARMQRMVFDKTGTLTRGLPELYAVDAFGLDTEATALATAARLATHSEHPLARSILRAAGGLQSPAALAAVAVPGGGITAEIDGAIWALGSQRFIAASLPHLPTAPEAAWSERALSETWLAGPTGWVARFGFRDELRPGARDLIEDLRSRGIAVSILSGDHPRAVAQLAQELGISDFQGGLQPQDKLAAVKEWIAKGEVVAMVGDGVNDAPVLAAATVSVALSQGTPLARSAADAVLLNDDLTALIRALAVARRGLMVIRQNLAWAVLWNLSVLPAASLGLLSAWVAALGMSLSSLLVILNALRLTRG